MGRGAALLAETATAWRPESGGGGTASAGFPSTQWEDCEGLLNKGGGRQVGCFEGEEGGVVQAPTLLARDATRAMWV